MMNEEPFNEQVDAAEPDHRIPSRAVGCRGLRSGRSERSELCVACNAMTSNRSHGVPLRDTRCSLRSRFVPISLRSDYRRHSRSSQEAIGRISRMRSPPGQSEAQARGGAQATPWSRMDKTLYTIHPKYFHRGRAELSRLDIDKMPPQSRIITLPTPNTGTSRS
jgi:hypothetical protein